MIEWIGFLAGILVTSAHAPQIYKSITSKKTNDISLHLYSVLSIGIVLWLVYGIVNNALAVAVMNVITLGCVITMIILKLKYGIRNVEIPDRT